jgi:hypothetical protein
MLLGVYPLQLRSAAPSGISSYSLVKSNTNNVGIEIIEDMSRIAIVKVEIQITHTLALLYDTCPTLTNPTPTLR